GAGELLRGGVQGDQPRRGGDLPLPDGRAARPGLLARAQRRVPGAANGGPAAGDQAAPGGGREGAAAGPQGGGRGREEEGRRGQGQARGGQAGGGAARDAEGLRRRDEAAGEVEDALRRRCAAAVDQQGRVPEVPPRRPGGDRGPAGAQPDPGGGATEAGVDG